MIAGTRPAAAQKPVAPSRDVDDRKASELWVKFSKLPRPRSEPHVFRAKGIEIGTLVFQVLSAGEMESAVVDAHRITMDKLGEGAKGTLAFEEMYSEQKALHLVVLACRQPDPPHFPTFLSVSDVRENLTDDEVAVLLAAYTIFRRESGPVLSEVSLEECEAWYELLARGASRSPLAACSGEALTDLVMYLVSRLRAASSTATSSAGSPPGGPSTPIGDSPQPDAVA